MLCQAKGIVTQSKRESQGKRLSHRGVLRRVSGYGRMAVRWMSLWMSLCMLLWTPIVMAQEAAKPVMAHRPELTIGIVPQQSAKALATLWIPMLAEVSKRAGVTLSFRTAPDIPAFEERVKAGDYDLAYMNPYHYTVFSKAPGYQAFAREKDRRLVGIVVVNKESAVKTLKDLQGQTVVFPAPAAFAASIVPQTEFARLGIAIQTKYVSSHDSVYMSVASGAFAAGGGIKRTLDAIDPAIAARLRILATTPSYVPHAFAAHPRVAASVLQKVKQAMLTMGNDETSRELMEPLSMKGFESGDDQDWNEIRQLGIDKLTGLQDAAINK